MCASIHCDCVACTESCVTVNSDISVTPMVSAAVVAATRPGLRRALDPASFVGVPKNRPGSQPRAQIIGPTISGPATISAANTRPPPPPISFTPPSRSCCPVPSPARTTPSTPRAAATNTRFRPIRPEAVFTSCCVRSASTGGTFVAARAGSTAETIVTTKPTAMPSTITPPDTTIPPGGSFVDVVAATTACSPCATPIPASTPRAEPTSPTSAASATVAPNTCPLPAPMQRSSATCRIRWATRIVNVL